MGDAADNILERTQARLNGIERELMRFELNAVTERFFDETTVWRQVQKLTIRPDKTAYVITTPHPTIRIGSIITVGTPGRSYRNELFFDSGVNRYTDVVFDPPNFLRFGVAPQETFGVDFATVLVPTDFEVVPEEKMARHKEALMDGLLCVLFGMTGKPWSSEKLTMYHGRLASRARAIAKRHADRAFGGPAWQFPPFA